MKTVNMIIAGFGGQGVLFTGKIIATAGLMESMEVSWLPSYGPEMRGGTANCSICLSEKPIGSPLVLEPDILIAMNSPSYEKFIHTVVPGGTVIIDSSLVMNRADRNDVHLFELPATQISKEKGLEGIANMILLGKLIRETGVLPFSSVEKAIHKSVPANKAHLLEHNLRAIQLGMSQ